MSPSIKNIPAMKSYFLMINAALGIALSKSCITEFPSPSTSYLNLSWKEVATGMPSDWYRSEEAGMAGDSVLKYQTDIGGWAKNSGFHNGGVRQEEWKRIVKYGTGATFDNGSTIRELEFLGKIYTVTEDERYRDAFLRAYNYVLLAQYPNGGWPQFYPYRKNKSAYSSHITYNDDVMLNIMRFLEDIMEETSVYSSIRINAAMRELAGIAFEKGVQCILNTQIIVDGVRTVWCAQHDEVTLEPAGARTYELPSFSGSESAGITLLLMDIDNPSEEIVNAIKGAVRWFEAYRIPGRRVKEFVNEEGEKDKAVIEDITAPDLWARFYDLETGKPFFCDRDGIKRNSLSEIGVDRRGGYRWYTDAPAEVIERYPEWEEKWGDVSTDIKKELQKDL